MGDGAFDQARGPRVEGSVVVVGGYGSVGRVVVQAVASVLPGRVVVAGRDGQRATALAIATRGVQGARQVDVSDPEDVERLVEGAAVVVMCVERANETVARACLTRGVHYVDISATIEVLDAIDKQAGRASTNGASAVLSVGLAPGLTNVLGAYCLDRLRTASSVDINVLLGLGGDHGPDSVRWTMGRLAEPMERRGKGAKRVDLPLFGRRMAYPFPFSDQRSLRSTRGVPVTTRVCFDSSLVTRILFTLRAARFFEAVQGLGGAELMGRASSRMRIGDDRFAVHAAAVNRDGARVSVAAVGSGECRATGLITAKVVERLIGGRIPIGIWHLDQVVDPVEFLSELPAVDVSIYEERDVGRWALVF